MPILGKNGRKVTLLRFNGWASCPKGDRVAQFNAEGVVDDGHRWGKAHNTIGVVSMTPTALEALRADTMGGLYDAEHSVLEQAGLG